MLRQAPAPAAPPVPASPPSRWATYAREFEDIYDAPVDDAAAVIGVDTIWLGGFLLSLKFLLSGLWLLKKPSCPVPPR